MQLFSFVIPPTKTNEGTGIPVPYNRSFMCTDARENARMPENEKLFSCSLVQKYAAGHVYTSFLKPTVTIHIYFS